VEESDRAIRYQNAKDFTYVSLRGPFEFRVAGRFISEEGRWVCTRKGIYMFQEVKLGLVRFYHPDPSASDLLIMMDGSRFIRCDGRDKGC